MLSCGEESFKGFVTLISSFSLLNSKGHEESVATAKPHLPLTAMTKTSTEAPAAPQEPGAKSAEQSAKCGEQEGKFLSALQGEFLV